MVGDVGEKMKLQEVDSSYKRICQKVMALSFPNL